MFDVRFWKYCVLCGRFFKKMMLQFQKRTLKYYAYFLIAEVLQNDIQ